jgi:hypothetical protein
MRKYLAKKMIEKSTKNASIRGVSLTEVLFATALTGVVIAAAGYGVSSLVSSSNAASARSDRRAEQNRSLDFMSAEIRESTGIVKDAQSAAAPSGGTGSTAFTFTPLGTGATKVLMVNTVATGATPIVYYTATPATGSWKGPRVVYRWGPTFDNRGNYTNASSPDTWTHEVLIDNIAAASTATQILGGIPGTGRVCTNTTDNPSNGGTYNGDSGFNACVDAAGRTAVIRQDGQIAKVLGTSENYIASTNTGARRISAVGPTPSSLPTGAITANLATTVFTKDDPTGVVTVNKPSTITVTTLPGDGYPGDTSVRVAKGTSATSFTNSYFTSNSTLMSIPKSTTTSQSITVTVAAGEVLSLAGCSNLNGTMTGSNSNFFTSDIFYCPVSTANQGNTVFTFKQGDFVPDIAGAKNGSVQQPSLREILTGSKTIANVPAYSASTGKGLKSNELFYVYEVYTTNTSSTYRDLQDIVVKLTFN